MLAILLLISEVFERLYYALIANDALAPASSSSINNSLKKDCNVFIMLGIIG
jgi:hypothetical protein